MRKIRSRESVINYIKSHCPYRYIVRSIESGTVEFLGGFRPLPPGTDPGWILRCHSPITRRSWNVAVVAKDSVANYRIRLVPKIQWEHWAGDESGLELYRGDDPDKYLSLKKEIRSIMYDEEN